VSDTPADTSENIHAVPDVRVQLSSSFGENSLSEVIAGSFPAPAPRRSPDNDGWTIYVSDIKRAFAAWMRECADWMDKDADNDDTYGPQGSPDSVTNTPDSE
jgi:hypothetical protein